MGNVAVSCSPDWVAVYVMVALEEEMCDVF